MPEEATTKDPVPQTRGWGATWMLPDKCSAYWGARAIADENYDKSRPESHIAGLVADRQSCKGTNAAIKDLIAWVNRELLPIYGYFRGDSKEVFEKDDGVFHARWTENKSYGYVYILAWKD